MLLGCRRVPLARKPMVIHEMLLKSLELSVLYKRLVLTL
jgi:hypothetical protein